MTNEKKQALKDGFKKVSRTVCAVILAVCLGIFLFCWSMLPHLYEKEVAELKTTIAALEAENAMYESQNARLDEEIGWLRSLIKQEAYGG